MAKVFLQVTNKMLLLRPTRHLGFPTTQMIIVKFKGIQKAYRILYITIMKFGVVWGLGSFGAYGDKD